MNRVTLRRTVEQVKHCLEEALSVIEREEDLRGALDDVSQAQALLEDTIVPNLKLLVSLGNGK